MGTLVCSWLRWSNRRPGRLTSVAVLVLILCALLVACGPAARPTMPAGTEWRAASEPSATARVELAASDTPVPTLSEPTVTPTTAPPPAPLAAIMNGQYIFLAEYERRLDPYEQALLEQGIDLSSMEGQAYLADVRLEVLDSLIDLALIEQGALALGVDVSESEVIAQVQEDIEAGGGLEAFEGWLRETGQTREEYHRLVYEALLVQRALGVISAGVSDAAEQVHIRHIQVDDEGTARELLDLFGQGHEFAELAREYSVDLATKDDGGDMGWFARGMLAPELEAVAFSLLPGEISEPFWLGEGYQIVQVLEREAERPLSPEAQLDLQLSLLEEWLSNQRESAVIEFFVGE
jgi:hypothetical protein